MYSVFIHKTVVHCSCHRDDLIQAWWEKKVSGQIVVVKKTIGHNKLGQKVLHSITSVLQSIHVKSNNNVSGTLNSSLQQKIFRNRAILLFTPGKEITTCPIASGN